MSEQEQQQKVRRLITETPGSVDHAPEEFVKVKKSEYDELIELLKRTRDLLSRL